MSDMIERVAKAIYEGRNGAGAKPWSRLTQSHQGEYLGDAIAAIEAMREHSPEQEERMRVLLGEDKPPTRRWHWVWWEMIDAALQADQREAAPK